MRTTSIVTISIPSALATKTARIARKKNMTRSELVRAALRVYIEEHMAEEAIRSFRKEEREGTLKELTGSLADLM